MKKVIIAAIFLGSNLFTSSAFSDAFSQQQVYQYKNEKGTLVFSDKKPGKSSAYKTLTVKAAKSTGGTHYVLDSAIKTSHKKSKKRKTSKRKPKKKTSQLAKCKQYKERFNAVSEKMRIGYKAKDYRKLEKKRVKYRDLLFKQCDMHELL